MKKRARQIAETRQRIVEAAMRLHTSVGPANTTISAVAKEADVTRVTVYNHFPDEEHLFLACSAHWTQLHPPPDPQRWTEVSGLEPRSRQALDELYGWFRDNDDDLYPLYRDFTAMPPAFQQGVIAQFTEIGEALVVGSGVRGHRRDRLRAVAGHVTSYWTWRSLVVEQGLSTGDAVDLGVGFILSV
ncbi:MAG: TetR/AcrR family transcriptional regulator [Actinomycetota bacterium]